jgi:hypothetical protein
MAFWTRPPKVTLDSRPLIAESNKLTADDWNTLTSIINQNRNDLIAPGDQGYVRQGDNWVGVGSTSLPDGTFTSLTANNITLNPTNQIRNNYLLTRSGDGRITLDFTGVPEGAEGLIEVVNSGVVRKLGFADFSDWKIGQDILTELSAIGASGKTITGAANNGSGLIRITSTAHGFSTNDRIEIASVVGTVEANGKWTVTVIDADNFDLVGSTFVNAYTSGGTATLLENFIFLNEETNGTSVFSFYKRGAKLVLNGNAFMI